jgi:hypothetical protein
MELKVVDEIVRPPLESVQARVAANAAEVTQVVLRLDVEAQDGRTNMNNRLAGLGETIERHAAANNQQLTDIRQATEQLRLGLAAVTALNETAKDVVRRQEETRQAVITLEVRLRRQTLAPIAAVVILVLAAVVVVVVM